MTPEENRAWSAGWWAGMRAGVRWDEKLEKIFAIFGCLLLLAAVVFMLVAIGLA
jgi:hypothetical protein